jgi:hypothetical protein
MYDRMASSFGVCIDDSAGDEFDVAAALFTCRADAVFVDDNRT